VAISLKANESIMHAFLVACVAFVLLGIGTYFSLNTPQEPSGAAYTQQTARIDSSWSWRLATTTSPAETCTPRTVSQWFFVDFRDPAGELAVCKDLQ
jgi:hypothetical protein